VQLTEDQKLDLWEIAAIAFFRQRLGLNKRQAQLFLALDTSCNTCADLSEVLNTTPAAISRMTAPLFSLGLVERDDYNPKEKISFYLTPKGQMELDMFPEPGARPRSSYHDIDRSLLPIMTAAEIEAQLCN
jgi:DNA-binding MarR family transcriptional regulator